MSNFSIIPNSANPVFNASKLLGVNLPTTAPVSGDTIVYDSVTSSYIFQSNSGGFTDPIDIGTNAGASSQGLGAIAIGVSSGQTSQGVNAVSIGKQSGQGTQGTQAVAIGLQAGQLSQSTNAVAIGSVAGQTAQGDSAIAIGVGSAQSAQGPYAIAIGSLAGRSGQGDSAITIGVSSGQTFQGASAVAIGNQAGQITQGASAVAVGTGAGQVSQGASAIAIGQLAGQTSQHANSIILNASGVVLNSAGTSRLYVNPVRTQQLGETQGALQWDSTSKEIFYNTTKTFVINHPLDKEKYLVHACLEGPESGVYYKGKGCICGEDDNVEIALPEYVDKLATEFVVNITPIGLPILLSSSLVVDGKFTVYRKKDSTSDSCNTEFFWVVFAKRESIVVEPSKNDISIKGSGPYKWIE
jgi:hypothetical protein